MDGPEIVARNFKPRENILTDGQKIIYDSLKTLPPEASIRVAIVDQGHSFLISVVALSGEKIFSSETHHLKAKIWGYPRDWQLGALVTVVQDLMRQIRFIFKKKDLSAKESLQLDYKEQIHIIDDE